MDLSLPSTIRNQLYNCVLASGSYNIVMDQSYVVISSNNYPRWVIPLGSATSKATLLQWSPYGLLSKLKWCLVCSLSPYSLLQLLPNAFNIGVVELRKDNITSVDKYDLKTVSPIIYVGTQGLQQKAVGSLICAETGEPLAIMKIALGKCAINSLSSEAEALNLLDKFSFAHAPKLICKDSILGYTMQSVIGGKLSSRCLSPQHVDVLCELADASPLQTTSYGTLKAQLVKKYNTVRTHIESDFDEMGLNVLEQYMNEYAEDFDIPVVFVHGDFAPWNIKLVQCDANGRFPAQLVLIDWEDFKENGFPLWDLSHFCFLQAHLFEEKKWIFFLLESPLVNSYLDRLFINREHKRQLIRLYLFDIIVSRPPNVTNNYHRFLIMQLNEL